MEVNKVDHQLYPLELLFSSSQAIIDVRNFYHHLTFHARNPSWFFQFSILVILFQLLPSSLIILWIIIIYVHINQNFYQVFAKFSIDHILRLIDLEQLSPPFQGLKFSLHFVWSRNHQGKARGLVEHDRLQSQLKEPSYHQRFKD